MQTRLLKLFSSLLLVCSITVARAQNSVEEFKADLTEAAVEEKVSKDAPIDVGFLSTILKKNTLSENVCSNKKQIRKAGNTKLVLLLELAPLFKRPITRQDADLSEFRFLLPNGKFENVGLFPADMVMEGFSYANFDEHLKRANDFFKLNLTSKHQATGNTNYNFEEDFAAVKQRDFGNFIEVLVYTLTDQYYKTRSSPDDHKAADRFALEKAGELINQHFKTEDEKMLAIAALNERLYWGYNEAKNPLSNNSTNNPDHVPLTPGYVGITQQSYASTSGDVIYGDNCNGFAITAAMTGKSLSSFDGVLRDNLTIEQSGFGGSFHFAALTTAQKQKGQPQLINVFAGEGLTQYDKRLGLGLWADGDASKNFRIQQVDESGTQKDIFVGDSSYGTYLKKMIDANNPYDLQVTPNLPMALVKAVKDLAAKRKAEYGLSTTELMNRTKIIAVFASYDTDGKWVDQKFSGAVTNQFTKDGNIIRFHVDEKFMIKHVFQIDSTHVWLEGGARAGLEVGVLVGKKPKFNIPRMVAPEYTGNFEANLGVGVDYENKDNGLKISAAVRENLPIGSKNWEAMTGKGIAKNLTLIPNITSATVDLEKTLGKQFSLVSSVKYLGTQVGQDLNPNVGFSYSSPSEVKVTTYVGYTQKFKGMGKFGTHFNYLEKDQGGLNASLTAESKKAGFNFCAQVSGLTPSQTASVSESANVKATFSKTLDFKKKKKK